LHISNNKTEGKKMIFGRHCVLRNVLIYTVKKTWLEPKTKYSNKFECDVQKDTEKLDKYNATAILHVLTKHFYNKIETDFFAKKEKKNGPNA